MQLSRYNRPVNVWCPDLRWIALRYFNAAGADPDAEIGEAHDPEPHLVPRVGGATKDDDVIDSANITRSRRRPGRGTEQEDLAAAGARFDTIHPRN